MIQQVFAVFIMVFSKVEVNLRRLLQEAPRQQNQAKLAHYISTARELLEQLGAEITTEGVPRVSKAKLSEYSEKIEALAATLAASVTENENPVDEIKEESSCEREKAESPISLSAGLRRRSTAQVEAGTSSHDRKERDTGAPIKLDAEAQANIEKHRPKHVTFRVVRDEQMDILGGYLLTMLDLLTAQGPARQSDRQNG